MFRRWPSLDDLQYRNLTSHHRNDPSIRAYLEAGWMLTTIKSVMMRSMKARI